MLRIDRKQKRFIRLEQPDMATTGIVERHDLQLMIRQSPEAFFAELGEPLLLIGEEVRPADFVDDRIDLLAIDEQGSLVVIELKRASHKLQLLQALGYAGMVAKWQSDRLLAERSKLICKNLEDASDDIEEFLHVDMEKLNQSQRIILMAEQFDYEVLVTAEWLNERYDLDIRCYRMELSAEGDVQFLNCTCIYPPPEISQHATRRRSDQKPLKWSNWKESLADIENKAIVKFYTQELEGGREYYLRERALWYRIGTKRRWAVQAHRKNSYVWQKGRFANDVTFWAERLSQPDQVEPVERGKALRFFLTSDKDFTAFRKAVTEESDVFAFVDAGESPEAPAEIQ